MEIKREWMHFASAPEANIRALCQRYGVSPTTDYTWLARYLSEGEAGLEECSRRPRHSPWRIKTSTEKCIVEATQKWPFGGQGNSKYACCFKCSLPYAGVLPFQGSVSRWVQSVPRPHGGAPNQMPFARAT